VEGAANFMVKATALYIPFAGNVDVEAEIFRMQEELNYNRGFLETVVKKLSNEKFVGSAPVKVVEIERKKQADAEEKIKILEERISALK
jgi:valyl-tRNA synthetase